MLATTVIASGCIPRGVLVAETGEHRLVANDGNSGLTVVVTTGVWDGRPEALDHSITVMHVLVANMGTTPVRLAPGDFDLIDEHGFRYELLDAGGSFYRSMQGTEAPRGYAPGRSPKYSTIASVGGDVARLALPWGVLDPGAQMRGYLYFENVERTAHRATLTWHATQPNDATIADLVFPLFVARS